MGNTYYFCSENCVNQFDADPHKFAGHAHAESSQAGSVPTGFNSELALVEVELPVIGLKKAGQSGAELIRLALRSKSQGIGLE